MSEMRDIGHPVLSRSSVNEGKKLWSISILRALVFVKHVP